MGTKAKTAKGAAQVALWVMGARAALAEMAATARKLATAVDVPGHPLAGAADSGDLCAVADALDTADSALIDMRPPAVPLADPFAA